MATTHTEMGINRTGIATSPKHAAAMTDATKQFIPSSGNESEIALVRSLYAREVDPMGSVPPPPTIKGLMNTAVQGVTGNRPAQFIDKLGERLAFERTGVRLYEALLSKWDSDGAFAGGPAREELRDILSEEYAHFRLLEGALKRLGADPTVLTPSANFHATMSNGIIAVVVDPRTTLAQCLEAALVTELADNDCWEALVELATQAGEAELVSEFEKAVESEQRHLLKVRKWLAAAQDRITSEEA